MEEYRVLLADDEEEIRTGISRKIDWASLGFALVGEAGNGEEALELAEQLRPDVVLTDIKMPFLDGLELCRRLRVSLPGARLVVFSGFDDFEYARQAMSMGVSEYILKPINAPELRQVLEKLREQLDRQRLERRDMETLRRRYEESLPVLRELFYTRLLSGQLRPEQVQDRAARYEIDLPQGLWTAALVHVDGPGDEGERDELLLLSVQSFLEKHFALAGCAARVVLYGDMTALLVHLDREDRLYPLLEELERLSRLSQSYLGLRLTTGVGLPCRGPEELNHSAGGARSGGLAVEEVFGEGFTGAVSVSSFSSLEELGSWLGERCGRLHDLLGRRRSDSTWQMVERAKDYIAGHYTDEQLSVEALCSHIHLSPTYFSTLFKREVGMSFTAYVTKVRMDEAARLLRETDEKTYRIAEATGFSDPNYFSYVFKRHFGLSPSKFRAGQRE